MAPVCAEPAALCLKYRCAKPGHKASSYVFWKLTVLQSKPREYRRLEGMEREEARRRCLAMREAEENGVSGAMQTSLALPATGSRQTSIQTGATGKPRPARA